MSRTKSLGPANDAGVPADEILLAKLVQNTKARGLAVCYGPKYGRRIADDEVYACCAIGAADLTPDTSRRYFGTGLVDGHEGWTSNAGAANYMAGCAFREAVGGRAYRLW